MILNSNSTKPIYLQIAEWIESEILNNHFQPNQKVYFQYQLAEMYTINPATAAKGLNLLVDQKILYKKRGLGMFVTERAKRLIITKRREQTIKNLVMDLVVEARRLQISKEELIEIVTKEMEESGQNIVECRNLTKTYFKKTILQDLSFTIKENTITGLNGRNGAGKSTLMKLLAGFIKESSGDLKVFAERPFNLKVC